MQTFVSIVRTGEELEVGLDRLQELKADIKEVSAHASAQYNPGWNEALDLKKSHRYCRSCYPGGSDPARKPRGPYPP